MADRKRIRRRKRRKKGTIRKILSLLLILVAILTGVTVFFEVAAIEVEGVVRYSKTEIIEAADINLGERLFFVDTGAVSDNIKTCLSYVAEVSVKKQFPNILHITVMEAEPMAYFQSGGSYWIVGGGGRILDEGAAGDAEGLAEIRGAVPEDPAVGGTARFQESGKASYLSELMAELAKTELWRDVAYIDLSNTGNVTLNYLSKFEIKLGGQDALEYKLQLLEGVLQEVNGADGGVIDLSSGKRAVFREE